MKGGGGEEKRKREGEERSERKAEEQEENKGKGRANTERSIRMRGTLKKISKLRLKQRTGRGEKE